MHSSSIPRIQIRGLSSPMPARACPNLAQWLLYTRQHDRRLHIPRLRVRAHSYLHLLQAGTAQAANGSSTPPLCLPDDVIALGFTLRQPQLIAYQCDSEGRLCLWLSQLVWLRHRVQVHSSTQFYPWPDLPRAHAAGDWTARVFIWLDRVSDTAVAIAVHAASMSVHYAVLRLGRQPHVLGHWTTSLPSKAVPRPGIMHMSGGRAWYCAVPSSSGLHCAWLGRGRRAAPHHVSPWWKPQPCSGSVHRATVDVEQLLLGMLGRAACVLNYDFRVLDCLPTGFAVCVLHVQFTAGVLPSEASVAGRCDHMQWHAALPGLQWRSPQAARAAPLADAARRLQAPSATHTLTTVPKRRFGTLARSKRGSMPHWLSSPHDEGWAGSSSSPSMSSPGSYSSLPQRTALACALHRFHSAQRATSDARQTGRLMFSVQACPGVDAGSCGSVLIHSASALPEAAVQVRSLSHIGAAFVTTLRAAWSGVRTRHIHAMPVELNNDAVLRQQSISALRHQVLPVALVL